MIRLLSQRVCLLSLFRNEKLISKDLSLLINIYSPKTTQQTFDEVIIQTQKYLYDGFFSITD